MVVLFTAQGQVEQLVEVPIIALACYAVRSQSALERGLKILSFAAARGSHVGECGLFILIRQ